MDLLAKWIGIFVMTLFLMAMPMLLALAFTLKWDMVIKQVLFIICFIEFIALMALISKSVMKD